MVKGSGGPPAPRRLPGSLWTLGAIGVTTGLALWLTNASLDLLADADGGTVRVAMIPPLWHLAPLIAGATLCLALLAAFVRRLATRDDPARIASGLDAIRPFAISGLLILPYLPWLPDAAPVLHVLAGPARYFVWAVVAWLTARTIWLAGGSPVRERAWPRGAYGAALVFVAATVIYGAAAARLTGTVLFPGGDEPHYLIVAQSLWREGDLKIENNHARRDYLEYFNRELAPHYLTRGVDNRIYSVHPVGMPFVAAPVYAAGGYRGVVAMMVLFAAVAAALLWISARSLTGSASAATFAWAACALSAPFIYNSFTIYPEVPAAAVVMAAFVLMQAPRGVPLARLWSPASHSSALAGWPRWLLCGLAITTLPWLSTKYALMATALLAVGLARLWWPPRADIEPPLADPTRNESADATPAHAASRDIISPRREPPLRETAALVLPFAIGGVLWLLFFYWIWGSFSPAAPYGVQRETAIKYLPAGGPGLLFDQEYGVIAFAPLLWLGVAGAIAMLRGRETRRTASEIAAIFGALLVTVGAFHIWWGGSATVGRPIVSGFLLLGIPLAWRYHQHRDRPVLLALYHALLALGLAVALTLGLAQNGLLLAGGRNGVSRLLDWLSPAWTLWGLGPSFIVQPPLVALLITAAWIAVASIAAWWLARRSSVRLPGRASALAAVTIAAAIVVASLIVPRAFARWQPAPVNLDARSRVALLDRYDAERRPIGLAYRSWPERLSRRELLGLVALTARAEDKRPRPPVPLLHNGRWSLPAGRYSVELSAGPLPAGSGAQALTGELGLQLGRAGGPARGWPVDVSAPGMWGRTFDLPIDVGFVGFTASRDLTAAAPVLRLRPQQIVDEHDRLPPLEVLSTQAFGDTRVFFHDEHVWPEVAGVWIEGGEEVRLTVVPPPDRVARLRVRASNVANDVRVAFETAMHTGGRADVALAAQRTNDVQLGEEKGVPVRVVLTTRRGFVPAEADASLTDRRSLGCWVEFVAQ